MDEVVTVLGGTNGAGTSHVTEQLAEDGDYAVTKQKRELIRAGEARGIPYEEIPEQYEELIGPAAERAVEEFAASDESVLLVDCHYAFQKENAVAMNLAGERPDPDEAYRQAIDDRLLSRFVDRFPTGFAFLSVDPAVAYRRLKRRQKNVEDEAVTLADVRARQAAERAHYEDVVERFDVDEACRTVVDNSSDGAGATGELAQFVRTLSRAPC